MEQRFSATFYAQSDIWEAINLMRDHPGNIRVASPYISDKVRFDWKAGDMLLIALSEINVRKGFVNPHVIEDLMDKGVKVYSNEKLHAKIYSNDEQAIICSCNLSYASQNDWLEAGVWLNDTWNLERVALFFGDNLKDSNLIAREGLVQLKGIFGIEFNAVKEKVTVHDLSESVWTVSLVNGEHLPKNLQKEVQSTINEIEKDKTNYSYYHFRTTNKDNFQVGDYIIQFKSVAGVMKIFFPARCIKVAPVTDNLFMVHLKHRGRYMPLEWQNLKPFFPDLDLSTSRKRLNQGLNVLERLYCRFNID